MPGEGNYNDNITLSSPSDRIPEHLNHLAPEGLVESCIPLGLQSQTQPGFQGSVVWGWVSARCVNNASAGGDEDNAHDEASERERPVANYRDPTAFSE